MVHLISFDRAAEYYDETRGFPPGVADSVTGSLKSGLHSSDRILELGIGTGRITIPLIAQKFKVTGIDISRGMMQRLRLNAAKSLVHPPDLIEGDINFLPFAPNSFEIVLAVHVLHLTPTWQVVISEVIRLLTPRGSFIMGYESHPDNTPYHLIRDQFDAILFSQGFESRRYVKRDFEEVHQRLLLENAVREEWVACEWISSQTPAQALERIESRKWSSTWNIPETIFRESIDQLRSWVGHTYPDKDLVHFIPTKFIWRKYSWPDNGQSVN